VTRARSPRPRRRAGLRCLPDTHLIPPKSHRTCHRRRRRAQRTADAACRRWPAKPASKPASYVVGAAGCEAPGAVGATRCNTHSRNVASPSGSAPSAGHQARPTSSTALKGGLIALLSLRLLEFWGYEAGHEGPREGER
jgi:hypothetical protein